MVNDWDSVASLAFLENPEFVEAMKAAVVLEPPQIIIFNEVKKEV